MRDQRQRQTLFDDEATLVVGGEETTLVAPRFDDEETLVARPVVPLDADAPSVAAPERPTLRPAQDYRSPYAPRRARALALVLVSVLVGGVLGGAGLYLYQRQSQDPAVSPAAASRPTTPEDAAQAPAAPAQSEQAAPDTQPSSQPTEAPAAAAPNAEGAESPAPVAEAPSAAPAREPENVPATERRAAPADGAPKRGKKGERDEEFERRAPRPDDNVARTDQPEARRVDSIFGRPRRAARRTRRDGDGVDRLRRIFEGTPQ